jgi:hypothetical protein
MRNASSPSLVVCRQTRPLGLNLTVVSQSGELPFISCKRIVLAGDVCSDGKNYGWTVQYNFRVYQLERILPMIYAWVEPPSLQEIAIGSCQP